MKFSQLPTDVFQKLAVNAGVLLTNFDTTTATVSKSDILGATSGGVTVVCTPSITDWGDDVDNCPKNTKELMHIEKYDCKFSGSMISADTAVAKKLIGAADIGTTDTTKITPRFTPTNADFSDLWYVCDYSDENNDTSGGYIAVKLMNAFSSGGFSLKSTDKGKGTFDFEFTGYSTTENVDTVPMEFYIKTGTAA